MVLCYSEFEIDWQVVQSVQNSPTQFVSFGRKSVKLTVESVGYTYHVFIENTRLKQVSATSIRSRVGSPSSKSSSHHSGPLFKVPSDMLIEYIRKTGTSSRKHDGDDDSEEETDGGPPTPPLMMIEREKK